MQVARIICLDLSLTAKFILGLTSRIIELVKKKLEK